MHLLLIAAGGFWSVGGVVGADGFVVVPGAIEDRATVGNPRRYVPPPDGVGAVGNHPSPPNSAFPLKER